MNLNSTAERGADMARVRVESGSASSVLTSQTMPPELMAEAARRLPWLGLVFSVTYILHRLGQRTVIGLTGTMQAGLAIQDAFDLAAVTLGIAVFFLARSKVLTTAQKLQLALVFQVAAAFAIALTEFWRGLPARSRVDVVADSSRVRVDHRLPADRAEYAAPHAGVVVAGGVHGTGGPGPVGRHQRLRH